MRAQLSVSGREILSGLRWRALRGGAGGLISPSGSCGRMPGTASPAPRVREKACRFCPLESTYNAGRWAAYYEGYEDPCAECSPFDLCRGRSWAATTSSYGQRSTIARRGRFRPREQIATFENHARGYVRRKHTC